MDLSMVLDRIDSMQTSVVGHLSGPVLEAIHNIDISIDDVESLFNEICKIKAVHALDSADLREDISKLKDELLLQVRSFGMRDTHAQQQAVDVVASADLREDIQNIKDAVLEE